MWVLALLLSAALGAQPLDEAALREALALGRGQRFDQLQAFHAGYHLPPAAPIVTELDVITPYRRAVLLAAQSARLGQRWTTRDLAAALAPYAGRIAVHAVVRLHPQNVFVTPPPFAIELRDGAERAIEPLDTRRDALYPPRAPREGAAMSAISVEAAFDAPALDRPSCCDVVLLDQAGAVLLRQPLALGRFR
jgi:hypothetical protein